MGIALLADPAVRLAFGEKWLEAIPVIQIIGVFSAFTAMNFIAGPVVEALGQLSRSFQITVASTILRVILGVTLIWWFGLIGAAISSMISNAFTQVLYVIIVCRTLRTSVATLIAHLWRPTVGCACMTLTLIAAGLHSAAPDSSPTDLIIHCTVGMLTGTVVYGSVVVALWVVCGRPQSAETDVMEAFRLVVVSRFSKNSPSVGC